MARILGLRVQHAGQPPQGRYLLISNHLSYIDILAFMNVVDARFLSKAEVANWPGIGPVARFAGTLFVDRTRRGDLPRVIDEIEGVLASGRGVVFFPEGTSTSGAEVAPFRASLLEPAAEARRPVHVASLSYRTAAGMRPPSEVVCWWGDMEFGPHLLQFLGLKRVYGRLEFGTTSVVESDRKLLAEKLWRAVDQLFIPMA